MTVYLYRPEVLDNPRWAEILALSNDIVRQVGAILILSDGREFTGYNHIPWSDINFNEEYVWKTNRNVGRALAIHAEKHALEQALATGVTNFEHSILVVTLAPCQNCRALIEACGIETVFYGERYEPRPNMPAMLG